MILQGRHQAGAAWQRQDETSRHESFRMMQLGGLRLVDDENQEKEEASCVDGNDVEEQGEEDDADDSTAGGEHEDDDRWTMTENEK